MRIVIVACALTFATSPRPVLYPPCESKPLYDAGSANTRPTKATPL